MKDVIESAIVNGALGSVGLALVDMLLKKNVRTYAVVYPNDPRIQLIPKDAKIISCDMRKIDGIKELINEPVDAFFHLAWMGTIGYSRDDMLLQTENIRCAINAANAAAELGCKVFVGTGSQAEHGRIEGIITPDLPCFPTTGYGMAKLCAGQMTRHICRMLGLRHVWARILSVYGPNDGPLSVTSIIIDKLLAGEKPQLTAGEQMWDYLYADDAAEGLICMALSGNDGFVYPLGSGKVRPLREYFNIIRDSIDKNLELGIGEMPYAENQVMYLQADITSLKNDTGFEPRISFEEGIERVIRIKRKNKQ